MCDCQETHFASGGPARLSEIRWHSACLKSQREETNNVADGIYIGMSAAVARAAQLDSIADNLANTETPGFKATRPAFRAFLPPGPTDKILAGAVSTGVDLRPGPTNTTDNPLDVVPEGNTYLGVQLSNGQTAYTRNGHMELGPNGELMILGLKVMGKSGQPITLPPESDARVEING